MTALTQDALFDTTPPAPAPAIPNAPKRTHAHPRAPRRDPDFRAQPCEPRCIACGRPEHPNGLQHCWPTCSILCQHVAQPHKTDVCLITVHVRAELATLPYSGRIIAAVTCPHCGRRHAHAPIPGTRYLISGCQRPYIVHTPTS